MKGKSVNRDIAQLFLWPQRYVEVGGQYHATSRFTPGKGDPLPVVMEAERAPEPVWTGEEKVTPTGIRSPDRPSPKL